MYGTNLSAAKTGQILTRSSSIVVVIRLIERR